MALLKKALLGLVALLVVAALGLAWHVHGKRPQREVAAAYLSAKVWPYLTGFTSRRRKPPRTGSASSSWND